MTRYIEDLDTNNLDFEEEVVDRKLY